MEKATFQPVGVVHSPFHDRFGVPRQPGLVAAAKGTIELLPPCNQEDFVRGLDDFSHVWILFQFNAAPSKQWQATVRPPRLGGNRRVGVFASRSPFRPNALGLSVLQLESIRTDPGSVSLEVSGLDLLDATPVLDIKPYVPYVDAIPDARPGFAKQLPGPRLEVSWSTTAAKQLPQATADKPQYLRELITQMISLDPRPSYRNQETDPTQYHMRVADVDVDWEIQQKTAVITAVRALDKKR